MGHVVWIAQAYKILCYGGRRAGPKAADYTASLQPSKMAGAKVVELRKSQVKESQAGF